MIPEPAIALIVQDNLDIACSAIEKAAMERAVTDVDEGFGQAYELRRRHREVSAQTPNDMSSKSYVVLASQCTEFLGSICPLVRLFLLST